MKKYRLLIAYIILTLSISLYGDDNSGDLGLKSLQLGYSTLKDYKNTFLIEGSIQRVHTKNLSSRIGIGFLTTNSPTNPSIQVNWMPIHYGIGYYFPSYKIVRPYIYGMGLLNFMSFPFDNPTLGYGLKTGALVYLKDNRSVNIEVSQYFINSSAKNPLSFSIGFTQFFSYKENKAIFKRSRLLRRGVKNER